MGNKAMTSKCSICYNGKLSCSSIGSSGKHIKILRTVSTDTKQDSTTGNFGIFTFVYLNCHPFIAHGHYLYLITKTTNFPGPPELNE